MGRAAPKKMYEVRLFVEVPKGIQSPDNWDWDAILNNQLANEVKTPVTFVLAHETVVGKG